LLSLSLSFLADRRQQGGKRWLGGDRSRGWGRGCEVELSHQITADLIEQTLGNHGSAQDRGCQIAQTVDRPSEPAKLVTQQVQIGGLGSGRSERRFGPHAGAMPVRRDGSDLERQSGLGMDLQVQIDEPGRGTFERSTQSRTELGIVGLPDSLTRLEPSQVDRARPRRSSTRPDLATRTS